MFSQAVRDLRTSSSTGATPAEGQTKTAANLGADVAQQGVSVLLIDCDLRRPRMHSIMRIEREPGLKQVLLKQVTIETAVRRARFPTSSSSRPAGFRPIPRNCWAEAA